MNFSLIRIGISFHVLNLQKKGPACFCVILSVIFALMLERKLFRWCFKLFSYLSRFVSIHHDLLFLLILVFVSISWILVRALGHLYSTKIVRVPIIEIVWAISTCVFCFSIFFERFVETAECSGHDDQPVDLELRLGLPGPEIERDDAPWDD